MVSDSYSYDANGNQTSRTVGGNYTLGYDAENRMTGMTVGSGNASFVYDGDGNRVQGTVSGVTTAYIGNYFEWVSSTSNMKKYYYAGSTRVAMRTGSSTLNYLMGDHLGSTATTTDSSGVKSAEVRYYPWGTERYTSGTTPTTFKFTGQRYESGIGLYYYGARWYDSSLGRFIQPDSIIPGEGSSNSQLIVDYHELGFVNQLNQENRQHLKNSQDKSSSVPTNSQPFDRYSYTSNNPVRYNDPTGHRNCEEDGYNCNNTQISTIGPITNFLLSLPFDAKFWNNVSKGLDSVALVSDTYAAGVVTYGGIAGAGIGAPFIAAGAPEVPVVTGPGGMGLAELAVQPVLRVGNTLASLGTLSTIIADTKSGTTNIDNLQFSTTTLNSITLSTAGWLLPEAYLSFAMQSFSVANDFGLTSFPWSRLLH